MFSTTTLLVVYKNNSIPVVSFLLLSQKLVSWDCPKLALPGNPYTMTSHIKTMSGPHMVPLAGNLTNCLHSLCKYFDIQTSWRYVAYTFFFLHAVSFPDYFYPCRTLLLGYYKRSKSGGWQRTGSKGEYGTNIFYKPSTSLLEVRT